MAAGTWRSELRRVGLAIRKQCVVGMRTRICAAGWRDERRMTAAVMVLQQRQKRSASFVVRHISGAGVYFNEEQSLQAY